MKQVYVVMSTEYCARPLMAFEEKDDALLIACVIHDLKSTAEADELIKAIPIVRCDVTSSLQSAIPCFTTLDNETGGTDEWL